MSDTCTLCLNGLDKTCFVECSGQDAAAEADAKQEAPQACATVTGECGDSFHGHCLTKIYKPTGKSTCPNCPAEWATTASDEDWLLVAVLDGKISLQPENVAWKIGMRVKTPQGPGTIVGFRQLDDKMYKVQLDWTLANNSPVYSYALAADLKRVTPPRVTVGANVITPQGPGVVVSYRATDQMFVVKLQWDLAQGAPVFSYAQKTDLKPSLVGVRVITKQGPGRVVSQSYKMFKVLLDWKLAEGAPVYSYALAADLKLESGPHSIAIQVITKQGPGVIVGYRATDKMFKVLLEWNLANDAPVHSYALTEDLVIA
jgi:hypothetical protein